MSTDTEIGISANAQPFTREMERAAMAAMSSGQRIQSALRDAGANIAKTLTESLDKINDKAKANIALMEHYKGAIAAIGTMVTLRGVKMYEFLDRFVTVALPRVRDFRGISGRSFDGRGNYNIGVKEQIIFPEIEYDKVDALRGLNISITTTAKTDDECKALLAGFRFPFKN